MKVFYPALVTTAIFFGAISVNLHERNYGTVLFMALLAIPSVILQVLLSQKGYEIVGYILIIVPIILVYVGYSLGIQKEQLIDMPIVRKPTLPFSTINTVPERIESEMT